MQGQPDQRRVLHHVGEWDLTPRPASDSAVSLIRAMDITTANILGNVHGGPRYPITHVLPDPAGDGLLVFAYRDLFRVDSKLTDWRHLGSIELRYRWGRPDAVGS